MLKVEVIIEEVINGEMTQLRIGDDVYAVHYVGAYRELTEAEKAEIQRSEMNKTSNSSIVEVEKFLSERQKLPLDVGPRIAKRAGSSVYKNIAEMLKNKLDGNYTFDNCEPLLRLFYPSNPISTLKKSYSVHKGHLTGAPIQKRLRRKKKRRRQPANAIGFDETYHGWVLKERYHAIKNALQKYGVTPTNKYLRETTGLSAQQVNKVLHFMLTKGVITRYTSGDGNVCYKLKT